MLAHFDRITLFCFAASYACAFLCEIAQLIRPRPVLRAVELGFGIAGLFAHTVFLTVQSIPPLSQYGSLLLLAWVLAVFYLYGTLHYRRVAWGVFVLPLVLALIGLSKVFQNPPDVEETGGPLDWGSIHAWLLVLAAVGICVGFLASIMYLFQAHRLRAKTPPGQGVKLLNLERLERMNRHAIDWTFPFLTAGVLVGILLMIQGATAPLSWNDPRILGSIGLWLVFAILLYLRYGLHLRGRRVALMTIVAFCLLVFTLIVPHAGVGR
jgi:ABC-type transport system involved in cytochrome c biogenesis permease subunit